MTIKGVINKFKSIPLGLYTHLEASILHSLPQVAEKLETVKFPDEKIILSIMIKYGTFQCTYMVILPSGSERQRNKNALNSTSSFQTECSTTVINLETKKKLTKKKDEKQIKTPS